MPTANTNRISIVNYSSQDSSLIRSLDCLTGICSTELGTAHEFKVDLNDILKTTVDYALDNHNDGFTMFVKVTGEDLVFEPNVAYTLKIKFSDTATYSTYGNVVLPSHAFEMRESVKFAQGDILVLHQTAEAQFSVVNPDANRGYLTNSDHSLNSAYLVKGIGANTNTTQFLRNDGTWVAPTDTKVSQTQSTTTSWRPLLLGKQSTTTTNFNIVAQNDVCYVNTNLICSPGNGYIRAVQFITKDGNATQFVSGNGTLGGVLGSATNAHATNKSYVVSGSGYSGTGAGTQFLREDGKWVVPDNDNTTYAQLTDTDHNENNQYVVNGSGYTGTATKFLKEDGSWEEPIDTNTTYAQLSSSAHASGSSYVVKGIGNSTNTTHFLRNDGTWVKPTNTTYATLTPSAHSSGTGYLVGGIGQTTNEEVFLRNDGAWEKPITVGQLITTTTNWRPIVMGYEYGDSNITLSDSTNVVYVNSTVLCSPKDGNIIAGKYIVNGGTSAQFLKADGTFGTALGSATNAHMNGVLYAVNGSGYSGNPTKFLKEDGSWGIPTNTTYGTFTTAANGLVPKPTAAQAATNYVLAGNGSWVAVSGGGSPTQAVGLYGAGSGGVKGLSIPTTQNGNNFPNDLETSYEGSAPVTGIVLAEKIGDINTQIRALPVEISDDGVIYVPISYSFAQHLVDEFDFTLSAYDI